jgi:hypothetical protein
MPEPDDYQAIDGPVSSARHVSLQVMHSRWVEARNGGIRFAPLCSGDIRRAGVCQRRRYLALVASERSQRDGSRNYRKPHDLDMTSG